MKLRMEYAFIIMIVLASFYSAGCAVKPNPDNVPAIANTIKTSADFIASQGLKFLHDRKPDQVAGAIDDLNSLVAVALLYSDDKVSVSDVVTTVTTALNRLNLRFDLVGGNDSALILATIGFLGNGASFWFTEGTLPQDFGIYLNSLALGIQDGIAWYNTTEGI